MCGVGTGRACRQLFTDCKILTVISLYVYEVLCCLKKYKSSAQKRNRYMVIIQGQIWIYISKLVIQISIRKV